MDTYLIALFAFFIAVLFTGLELVTSRYQNTFFVLRKSGAFWTYLIVYGMIGFLVMVLFNSLAQNGTIKLEGYGTSNAWIQAFAIGVSTKALLHLRLFQLAVGTQSFPVGLETITSFFEHMLMKNMVIHEFNGLKDFIAPAKAKYTDINEVKTRIKDNIPTSITGAERTAILADIDEKRTTEEAMEVYIRNFGKKSFWRVFPV